MKGDAQSNAKDLRCLILVGNGSKLALAFQTSLDSILILSTPKIFIPLCHPSALSYHLTPDEGYDDDNDIRRPDKRQGIERVPLQQP
jgi:hypothetical protein